MQTNKIIAFENFILQIPKKGKSQSSTEGVVNVITLGCDKNRVDSEQLAAQLKTNGFAVYMDAPKACPITIVNTCGFINDSKIQSVDTILNCIEAKKRGSIKHLIVFGCLSQRYPTELEEEIPEVDAWFGVNALQDILDYLQTDLHPQQLTERLLSTPSHYAYLKISEGCNHGCAFCAIPQIRGRHTSKPKEIILQEARLLAEKGVKELILVAQDLSSYGLDLYHKPSLAELVESLAKLPFSWIRLHYVYPNHFQTDLLKVMKDYPNICHYLDMPLQHINNEILHSMRRNITGNEIRNLLENIRKEIPDIALRTSLIVGYPGETKKIFNELTDFVMETRFERLGVFTYSHEENTPAYALKDNVTAKEKERRKEEVMWIQQEIAMQQNQAKIGETMQVLIDDKSHTYYEGRTVYDSPEVDNIVLIPRKGNDCQTGTFHKVHITSAEPYELKGKLADNQ